MGITSYSVTIQFKKMQDWKAPGRDRVQVFWLKKRRSLPYLPVYKLTFYSLKIGPKNCPRLIHGSKTEIKKKFRTNFSRNHNVPGRKFQDKDTFFKKNFTTNKKISFGSKMGGRGGSTYAQVLQYMGEFLSN